MARNTRPTPYDEQAIGAFDEAAGGAEFMAYGSTPSTATESYPLLPEDPMPLFLSDAAERPRARGFGTGTEKNRTSAVVWPRIFKAGIFAASAAAIAFAFLSVDNPLALFANARASLIGSSADQSGATPKSDPQPAGPLQLASNTPPLPMPSTAGDKASAPAARVTPSRDDIALALRAAHQSQMESVQSPAAAPPARRLDADELAALLKRAKGLIAIGDIAPARLLLERAADAQEAGAALLLAQTYDPAVLGTPDMRSITPDPAAARDWYQKAARLGSPDAKQRLAQMQN
jgi:TPR repeat protein